MKIYVKELARNGGVVEGEISAALLGVRDDDHLTFTKGLKVQGQADRCEDTLIVRGIFEGAFTADCARCLERANDTWRHPFVLDFPITRQTEEIDGTEVMCDEVLLNLPLKVLCQDTCRGLCPGCGVNLNETPCTCAS